MNFFVVEKQSSHLHMAVTKINDLASFPWPLLIRLSNSSVSYVHRNRSASNEARFVLIEVPITRRNKHPPNLSIILHI